MLAIFKNMITRRLRMGALLTAAAVTLAGCSANDANDANGASGANEFTSEATVTNEVTETAEAGDATPPDFASETRPVPDTVREAVGPICGEAQREGETYNIIAIQGGDRCAEAMEVVNDFTSEDSQAVQETDDSWKAINDWRCGRGTRLEDEPADAEQYTMNCWDAQTRVLFLPKPA